MAKVKLVSLGRISSRTQRIPVARVVDDRNIHIES